jgi:hypothetical protein
MNAEPITVNIIVRFSRETIACDKIALKSIEDMQPGDDDTSWAEWRERAIKSMRAEIAEMEKILDEQELERR